MLDKTLGYDPMWMVNRLKGITYTHQDAEAACWEEVERELYLGTTAVPGIPATEDILLASYKILQQDPPIFTAEFLAKVVVQGI